MNEVWVKFIEQSPWAAAIILTVYLFLKYLKESDTARSNNAKEMAAEQRAHELQINNMWAVNIKTIVERQDSTSVSIANALAEHEKASKERYDRMGITKELIEAVKTEQNNKKRQT